MTGRIFISYRRNDSEIVAHRMFDWLVEQFGSDAVFIDIDRIPYGADFRSHITDQVRQARVVLLIIGETWLEELHNRANDPDDWLRHELETAFAEGKDVIPVLIDRAAMPGAKQLPQTLAKLAFLNAAGVSATKDFRHHMGELAERIAAGWGFQARSPSGAADSGELLRRRLLNVPPFSGAHVPPMSADERWTKAEVLARLEQVDHFYLPDRNTSGVGILNTFSPTIEGQDFSRIMVARRSEIGVSDTDDIEPAVQSLHFLDCNNPSYCLYSTPAGVFHAEILKFDPVVAVWNTIVGQNGPRGRLIKRFLKRAGPMRPTLIRSERDYVVLGDATSMTAPILICPRAQTGAVEVYEKTTYRSDFRASEYERNSADWVGGRASGNVAAWTPSGNICLISSTKRSRPGLAQLGGTSFCLMKTSTGYDCHTIEAPEHAFYVLHPSGHVLGFEAQGNDLRISCIQPRNAEIIGEFVIAGLVNGSQQSLQARCSVSAAGRYVALELVGFSKVVLIDLLTAAVTREWPGMQRPLFSPDGQRLLLLDARQHQAVIVSTDQEYTTTVGSAHAPDERGDEPTTYARWHRDARQVFLLSRASRHAISRYTLT